MPMIIGRQNPSSLFSHFFPKFLLSVLNLFFFLWSIGSTTPIHALKIQGQQSALLNINETIISKNLFNFHFLLYACLQIIPFLKIRHFNFYVCQSIFSTLNTFSSSCKVSLCSLSVVLYRVVRVSYSNLFGSLPSFSAMIIKI